MRNTNIKELNNLLKFIKHLYDFCPIYIFEYYQDGRNHRVKEKVEIGDYLDAILSKAKKEIIDNLNDQVNLKDYRKYYIGEIGKAFTQLKKLSED